MISQKGENTYQVSDTNVDDFAMFRYEINSIFKNHQFTEERDSKLPMGPNPLSMARNGKKIRDLDENSKQQYIDMFRPPGIVRIRQQYYNDFKGLQNCEPNDSLMAKQSFGNANVDQV